MEAPGNIPAYLVKMVEKQYVPADAERIFSGSCGGRAITLRANTLRASRMDAVCALESAGISWTGVAWYNDALIVGSDCCLPDIRALPIYEEGGIYLQSLSSMLPPLALGAQADEDILDACAAPGGKTTQIAALAQGKAHITACEMHAPRAEKLEFNLRKLGASGVTVMHTDARRLDSFFAFDRILVDAPCSGSGTVDVRDPRTEKRLTPELVKRTRKAQAALMDKALRLLKPGGTLVYSTCSIFACENEDIVEEALGRAARYGSYRIAPVELGAAGEIPRLPTRLDDTFAVCPTREYEGFFLAKIVRNA